MSSLKVTPQAAPFANRIVSFDGDATPHTDVLGAPGTVYMVQVDNTPNGAEVVYLKLYDHGNPTVGTDPATMILKVAAGQKIVFAMPEGVTFGTSLSAAVVTTPGDAGTTSPTNPVPVVILAS